MRGVHGGTAELGRPLASRVCPWLVRTIEVRIDAVLGLMYPRRPVGKAEVPEGLGEAVCCVEAAAAPASWGAWPAQHAASSSCETAAGLPGASTIGLRAKPSMT